MIKLVAFDWNGTLLSDTTPCVRAENVAIKAAGGKPISITKFRQIFEIPVIKYWKALGFSDAALRKNGKLLERTFHQYYEKFVNQARTRAGTKEILRWLHGKKIERVIYSNHNVPNIHRQLVRLNLLPLIDVILARHQTDHSQIFERSKDQKLFAHIKRLKIKPGEVVSVGDSEEEIEIGKAYGYHTVAITGGYNSTPRLRRHHPNFLIHNMLELKKIIKQLNT